MRSRTFSRHAAAFGAAAAATALSFSALAPAAFAAPATASHTDSNSIYTRTISNTTPKPGDTITYTQKFETNSPDVKDYAYEWKNNVDACLEYQAGSATVQKGNEEAQKLPDDKVNHSGKSTTVKSTESVGYWTFTSVDTYTFQLTYNVTDSCKMDQELLSGFYYKYGNSFWGGTKTYASDKFNGGPKAVVTDNSKARSAVTLTQVPEKAIVDNPVDLGAKVEMTAAEGKEAPALVGLAVDFMNGEEKLCTATTDDTGKATCSWTPKKTGEVNVEATYAGTEEIMGSKSATKVVTVTVGPPPAPTDLVVNPANAKGKTTTTISGKAAPGTTVEATGPGGTRCVSKTTDEGTFSCNLGFLPAIPGTITVVATKEGVTSEKATIPVNMPAILGGLFNSPQLPKLPDSPQLPKLPSSPSLPKLPIGG